MSATTTNGRVGAALVAPGLGVLTLFLFVPLALIVAISLFTYSPTRIWLPIVTAANYQKFFHPYYLGVTWTTIKIGLLTTVVCAVLGYPVAYFLARARSRWLGVWLFLLVTPLMVSSIIRIFGWLASEQIAGAIRIAPSPIVRVEPPAVMAGHAGRRRRITSASAGRLRPSGAISANGTSRRLS